MLDSFRLGQREIIESLIQGKDVLAVMPTGGGKSLCYQLPAMIIEGITIVISPLIALMDDQVNNLKKQRIPVGSIHSGMRLEEKREVFNSMKNSKHFLLYISPERTQNEGFVRWFKEHKISFIAIDESHCVSQWGHDFRTEYAQLSRLRELKKEIPFIALTATATPLVKRDIIDQLRLHHPAQHVYGFYRPNLFYQVEFCQDEFDKEAYVLGAINQFKEGRILIYCGTRKSVEEWASLLNSYSDNVGFYHAGLSASERQQIQEDYSNRKFRILVATNAFGMGIDHPDVRLVLHTQIPGNIESYYQEIGRAGRDGQKSTCLLVYSKKDKGLQSFFINASRAEKKIKSMRWEALDAMTNYAEGSECRHSDILIYFNDKKRIKKCGHCDTCDPSSLRNIKPIKKRPNPTKKVKKKIQAIDPLNFSADQKNKMKKLRLWRKEYASRKDLPAFMVFSDKTLYDLISKMPKTNTELNNVYGLGQHKIRDFGPDLLRILK